MPVFEAEAGEKLEGRPRFQATHRVRIGFPGDGVPFAGTYLEEIALEGILTERGFYWVGYTETEWRDHLAPTFAFDARGRVWIGGEPLPPTVPVTVERL